MTGAMVLVLLVYVGLMLLLSYPISKMFKKRSGRWVFRVLCLLLPYFATVWDLPLDKRRFEGACAKDAGVTVFRRVALSDDYFYEPGELISRAVLYPDGIRVRRDVPAGENEVKQDRLMIDYETTLINEADFPSWAIRATLTVSTRSPDRAIVNPLGQYVIYSARPGWFNRWIFPSYTWGSAPTCPKRLPGIEHSQTWEEQLHNAVFYRKSTSQISTLEESK